jgi:hypothetical protein
MTDLEKAIELARKHEELYVVRNHEECCVAACQEMAEWKEQQMIDKACEWLIENYPTFDGGELYIFIKNFQQAMGEQQ